MSTLLAKNANRGLRCKTWRPLAVVWYFGYLRSKKIAPLRLDAALQAFTKWRLLMA